jgi:hypothetical protein
MKAQQLAKEIRASLATQPAFLNRANARMGQPKRTRVYDAVTKRDGTFRLKVIAHTPGEFGNGKILWIAPQAGDSITIFAGTAMEETYGLGSVII